MESLLSQSQPLPIPSPRKRGVGVKASRRPVSRALFGYPDPVLTRETLLNAIDAANASFRETWNFDPVTGLPCPVEIREGQTEEEALRGHRYVWTRILSQDAEEEEEDILTSSSPSPRRGRVNNQDLSWAANQSHHHRRDACEHRVQSSPLDNKKSFSSLHQRSIKDYMRVKKGTVFRPETKSSR